MTSNRNICGVILAGGKSRRMGGGDKCLITLGGKSLINRIIQNVGRQVTQLIINTNSDPKLFSDSKLPVVPDVIEGRLGPLAGVLTGLEWASVNTPECDWIATFASDAPFIPADLVLRLRLAIEEESGDMACAVSAGRHHPVFALWPKHLASDLRTAITQGGLRKVDDWTSHFRQVRVEFHGEAVDPFFNINRPQDLLLARTLLEDGLGGGSN